MQRQIDITDILWVVQIPSAALDFIKLPYDEAVKGLASFKSLVQRKKKELAKKYHPDKGGDEQRMKEINQAVDLLMTLEVQRVRPRPVMYSYPIYQQCHDASATNAASTGSVFYGYAMT